MDTTATKSQPQANLVPEIDLGHRVTLQEPPALFALAVHRTDGQIATGGFPQDLAYGAAALRMCWPEKSAWPVLHRPRPWVPGIEINRYGSDIFEELRKGTKGRIRFQVLRDACIQALLFALRSALTEDEVRAAQDFSEDQREE